MITITDKTIRYKLGQTFRLKPIFDVHLLNRCCDERAFRSWLGDADDNTLFIGGGDLMDSIIVTDPRYRKSVDGSKGDAVIDEQVELLTDLLKPYRLRILGLGSGNHEDTVVKKCGTNPIQRVCDSLDVPFLGLSWFYRLRFSDNGNRTRTMFIRGHHGWGGGSRTQGADLTKYSKDTAYYDADLFLYGHVHRRQFDRVPRLSLVQGHLVANPKVMVLCGTFLKTLTEGGDPSYSELKGYPPVDIGGVDIKLKPLDSGTVQITAEM